MTAVDTFTGRINDFPATGGEAVTPHDTNELTIMSRALWVGVAGDVKVKMRDGQTLTFTAMTVGWHPLRVKQVFATDTTATDIVAVY